jgi:hypothetical protein
MNATQTTKNTQHSDVIAFMFFFLQVMLVFGVYLAFKSHLV